MISEKLVDSILLSAFNGSLIKNNSELEKVNLSPSKYDGYYDIPSNWVWVDLNEIIDLQQGVQIDTVYQKKEEFSDSIKFLRIINFTQTMDDMRWVDKKFISKKSLVSENDLVMVRYGATSGNIYYATDGLLANNLFKIIINSDQVYQKYIYYFFKSNYIKIKILGDKGDTAMPSINFTSMRKIIIPIPPIEEQKRIVEKIEELLSMLDDLKPIENELNILKKEFPQEMNKAIIDYAIHGNLSVQSEKDSNTNNLIPDRKDLEDNYKKFNLSIDQNEIPFSIPSNWVWVKLGMLFNYQNGYSYKPSDTSKNGVGFPVIKSQNIMKRIVEINDQTSFVENPTPQMLKSKINKGDFLMCLSSQSNNPEPLGKTAIYNSDEVALLNQRVLKLTPINPELSKYLYYVINSFYFHNTVSHKGGGSAQSNLKLEHVMEMYIPLPPIEEQKRIVEKLNLLLPLCSNLEKLVNY